MSVNAQSGGHHVRAARTAPSSTGSTHMMTFDYGGDGEPRGNAQLGLHHHPRVVHPPLKRRRGQLCCLSARPHDLADLTAARPEVACVPPSYVPCVYSKRAALTRRLVFVFRERTFCRHYDHTTRGTTLRMVSCGCFPCRCLFFSDFAAAPQYACSSFSYR